MTTKLARRAALFAQTSGWRSVAFVGTFALLAQQASAQVFIQGVNSGNAFTDVAGNIYSNSAATIIRATGAGVTYSGQNISGSTLATANAFMAAQAQNGAQIAFTGLTNFTLNGTANSAHGFSSEGTNSLISAENVQLVTNGANSFGINANGTNARVQVGQATIDTFGASAHGVNVQSGANVNLGAGSRVTTETGTGVNVTSGVFNASSLTVLTNRSNLGLEALLVGLPQYPNLVGIDPLSLNHTTDPLGLSVYAIASPAKGISSTNSTMVLNGTTNITSGGIGLYVSGGAATLNGLANIVSGPGGTANTWIHGVNVLGAGRVDLLGGATIRVDSVAGSGIRADGVGSTAVTTGPLNISLVNTLSAGINNVNEAAALYASAGSIQATGPAVLDASQGRGYGLWTGLNAASAIRITGDTSIATHGLQGFGIRLDDGLIDLTGNLSIVTGVNPSSADALNGAGSAGLRAINGTMNVSGSTTIQTVGGISQVGSSIQTSESAYGLWNTSHSRLAGGGAALSFGGPVSITTAGAAAHGIYNDSASGTFNFASEVDIRTTGGPGRVTWFRVLGITPVNETVGAWGVNSAVSGTTTFQGALRIQTSGDSAGGVRSVGGTVNVQNVLSIATSGASAFGLYAGSATAGGSTYNGLIDVNGAATISTQGQGAHAVAADQNGRIQLDGGATLRVADTAAKGIFATGSSIVTGTGFFDVVADLQSATNALIDLQMTSASRFTGMTTRSDASTFNLSLSQGSIWTMTGDSNLTNLSNDASTVNFLPPVNGAFKTLTTVNYVGANGILGLNTFLGSDGSPSDKLVIDGGNASGSSRLRITNTTGPGALTVGNGILVVDAINAGTTATGAFSLGAPVVAGPYEYTLYRGSTDASNAQAWYLRSTLNCSIPGAPSPPCPAPTPPNPPTPNPPVPNYRAETSLYAALPAMVLGYGRNLIDTLHERVGEERPGVAPGGGNGLNPSLGWARFIGLRGQREGSPIGIYGDGPKYGYDIVAFQGGFDLYRGERSDGGRDHVGVYAAVGQITADVTHVDGTFTGKDSINAYSAGAYWTRFSPSGWYLDALAQYTWNDATAASQRLPKLKTDGSSIALSLESGVPFALGAGWQFEPQAQLIYQRAWLADASDVGATVRFQNAESLAGRVGARIARSWIIDGSSNDRPRQMTAWFRPNLWYEFFGDPKTEFSSAAGYIPFRANLKGAWLEANIGVDAQIMKNISLIANAGYQWGLDGRSEAYNGKVGLRANW